MLLSDASNIYAYSDLYTYGSWTMQQMSDVLESIGVGLGWFAFQYARRFGVVGALLVLSAGLGRHTTTVVGYSLRAGPGLAS